MRKLLLIASLISFSVAALLIIWYFVSEINFLEEKYWEYIMWLSDIENKVAAIENKWLIILVILLLYFILTAFPVFPISIICVASAMVFDMPACFAVNLSGLALLLAVRYSTGMSAGGGSAQWLVRKNRFVRNLIESEGQGNPWVLFGVRLLPLMPINPVSHLYGAMSFPFWKYLLISLVGFLPKMISYIVIGHNFANPFSPEFTIPLIFIAVFSGVAFLIMRGAWDVIKIVKEHK